MTCFFLSSPQLYCLPCWSSAACCLPGLLFFNRKTSAIIFPGATPVPPWSGSAPGATPWSGSASLSAISGPTSSFSLWKYFSHSFQQICFSFLWTCSSPWLVCSVGSSLDLGSLLQLLFSSPSSVFDHLHLQHVLQLLLELEHGGSQTPLKTIFFLYEPLSGTKDISRMH